MKVFSCSFVVVLVLIVRTQGHPLTDIHTACDRYVRCKTASIFDERVCMGNSIKMPFWLPPRDLSNTVGWHCHQMLEPYYEQLKKYEENESAQLLACLLENVTPGDSDIRNRCQMELVQSPKFDFTPDPIHRQPVQCFQGLKRRMDRQCRPLKECCPSIALCDSVEKSELTQKIASLKSTIRDLGKRCELGFEISANSDEFEAEHQPTGNLTVSFSTPESKDLKNEIVNDAQNQKSVVHDDGTGRLIVRLITADEEIQRLRDAGEHLAAERLRKLTRKTDPKYVQNTQDTTKTSTEDEFWDRLIPIKDENNTTSVHKIKINDDHKNVVATGHTTRNETKKSTVKKVARTQVSHDASRTKTSEAAFPVDEILLKYKHVPTHGKLAENYNNEDGDDVTATTSVTQPTDATVTVSTTTESVKLEEEVPEHRIRQFISKWNDSVRQKFVAASAANPNPENVEKYQKLLESLSELQSVLVPTD